MINRRSFFGAGAGVASLAAMPVTAISATTFGVKPNLARDQSAQLQKAINAAIKSGGELHLPGGIYVARKLKIDAGVTISGVPGLTRIVLGRPADFLLQITRARNVTLRGIVFDGGKQSLGSAGSAAIIKAGETENLFIDQCQIINSRANGIALNNCSGKIMHSSIGKCAIGGIFSLDARGLEIGHNHIYEIGDNGVMIWQSKKREDGSLVHNNRIEKILAKAVAMASTATGLAFIVPGTWW